MYPINFLSQVKQSHMQMELTYQEAGKPLPKAYNGDEGLISFTLGHMEEGIMEKVIEQRLRRQRKSKTAKHAQDRLAVCGDLSEQRHERLRSSIKGCLGKCEFSFIVVRGDSKRAGCFLVCCVHCGGPVVGHSAKCSKRIWVVDCVKRLDRDLHHDLPKILLLSAVTSMLSTDKASASVVAAS